MGNPGASLNERLSLLVRPYFNQHEKNHDKQSKAGKIADERRLVESHATHCRRQSPNRQDDKPIILVNGRLSAAFTTGLPCPSPLRKCKNNIARKRSICGGVKPEQRNSNEIKQYVDRCGGN